MEFRKDIYNVQYLSELGIQERQLDALLYFKNQKSILTSEYSKKYNIVDRTARRDLLELVEKGLLIREGEKKSSKYNYR